MRIHCKRFTATGFAIILAAAAAAAPAPAAPSAGTPVASVTEELQPESQVVQAAITIGGRKLAYHAETGIAVVHVKDPIDEEMPPKDEHTGAPSSPPHASMSYVAYFKGTAEDANRPITFVFNGGPGTATIWLHMGAFGPKRVLTADHAHNRAAPYRVVDNEFTLLDDTDLVFIDAPGIGFGHLRGADREKAFFGVDQDAHAFANFIAEFLSRHNRWNSPKFLLAESYGTTRAAALTNILQDEKSVDLNGVVFIGQILNYDNNADTPQFNPGMDAPYALSLPSFAASAWFHDRLPNKPAELEPFLHDVEAFALGEYWQALAAGAVLSAERKAAIAAKLHDYTGLPVDYILRSDLRVNVGAFAKNVLGGDITAARDDARFSGPPMDPLAREADYDPSSAALSAAFVAAFNDYVRTGLKFGQQKTYTPAIDLDKTWDFLHQPPGEHYKYASAANVMTDLAAAMKRDPNLKIQLNNGYYDLATPYFSAVYELRHLPIPQTLQGNLEMHFYRSGHMIYLNEPELKSLHKNIAAFIGRNR